MSHTTLLKLVNKTIHPNDKLAPVYETQHGIAEYFRSALVQTDLLEEVVKFRLGKPLSQLEAIADYACHYGRLLRALRVVAPNTELVACDIDAEALSFCEREYSARPFRSAWSLTQETAIPVVDLLICVSLLTHTRLSFLHEALALWEKMVRPGGLLVFTFLGQNFIGPWERGELAHYGPATPDDISAVSRDFRSAGHAFHSFRSPYSDTEYGVGFLSEELVRAGVAARGALELLKIRPGPDNGFGQDLAIVRRV